MTEREREREREREKERKKRERETKRKRRRKEEVADHWADRRRIRIRLHLGCWPEIRSTTRNPRRQSSRCRQFAADIPLWEGDTTDTTVTASGAHHRQERANRIGDRRPVSNVFNDDEVAENAAAGSKRTGSFNGRPEHF